MFWTPPWSSFSSRADVIPSMIPGGTWVLHLSGVRIQNMEINFHVLNSTLKQLPTLCNFSGFLTLDTWRLERWGQRKTWNWISMASILIIGRLIHKLPNNGNLFPLIKIHTPHGNKCPCFGNVTFSRFWILTEWQVVTYISKSWKSVVVPSGAPLAQVFYRGRLFGRGLKKVSKARTGAEITPQE